MMENIIRREFSPILGLNERKIEMILGTGTIFISTFWFMLKKVLMKLFKLPFLRLKRLKTTKS